MKRALVRDAPPCVPGTLRVAKLAALITFYCFLIVSKISIVRHAHPTILRLPEITGSHALKIIHCTAVLILIQHRPEHTHNARRVRVRFLLL